jgi:protein-disulfide isomerase
VLAKPRLTGLAPGDNPRQRHGPASADSDVITIYEFSDFECPYCAQLWTHAERAFAASPRPIEVIFVNFPLDAACNPAARAGMHEHACLAAIAGECAHRQGQFWPYAARVFAGQPTLDRRALLARAADLGLDQPAFTACLDDPAVLEAIRADLRLARAAGVTGTPTLIIDGYKYTGVARRPLIEALLNAVADRP